MRNRLAITGLLTLVSSLGLAGHVAAQVPAPPNVLLIVTDDQRWDTVQAMPHVMNDLVSPGVLFDSAHVTTPLCCPARAGIFTGQYAHTTGVYSNHNSDPHGGFNAFDDSVTVATVMHDAGYRTGLVGKYLNGYAASDANQPPEYIPPGWDTWNAAELGWGAYYNWSQNINGGIVQQPNYITDVEGQQALDFIGDATAKPWFLEWAPAAPHMQAVPEPDHAHDFDSLPSWRPPSYNESDVSDKPGWMQTNVPLMPKREQTALDDFRRRQYDTLMSVDDWVGSLVTALADSGQLANTLIVFTSDNGYYWGEHRLSGKNLPYQESERVPYVVRWDAGMAPSLRGTVSHELVTNIDLAPTAADLAGVGGMPNEDGTSLEPYLTSGTGSVRREHLAEQQAIQASEAPPAWCQLVRKGYVFTHYGTGEEEFYNLSKDPYELTNTVSKAANASRVSDMRSHLQTLCSPLPPGMTW
jgi:N-acetylglucosamine-6-sulfatase